MVYKPIDHNLKVPWNALKHYSQTDKVSRSWKFPSVLGLLNLHTDSKLVFDVMLEPTLKPVIGVAFRYIVVFIDASEHFNIIP